MIIVRACNAYTGEVYEINSSTHHGLSLFADRSDLEILSYAAIVIHNAGFDGDSIEVLSK